MTNLEPRGNGNAQDALHFTKAPERVVSLVPSMTESMFDLGFGDSLVGITDYCVFPEAEVVRLPRVGGTKNPRIGDILALQPDLVLANWEENTRPAVEAMRSAGLSVWVTFPHTVNESIKVLWELAAVFRSKAAQIRLRTLELTLDWAISVAGDQKSFRYFCPIWFSQKENSPNWWMTFNQHTYCHDLLQLFGGQNVFGQRERKYPLAADLGLMHPEDPGEADTRYPHVSLEEVNAAQPELILLPSEPYHFDEAHIALMEQRLADTPAVRNGCVLLIDGTLITWQGTRLAKALREIPVLLDSCKGE
jgi:iron complex transport system substrate-binding protein